MPVATAEDGRASVGTRLYASEYLRHQGRIERGEVEVLAALWGGNMSLRRSDCLRVGLASADFPVFYHSDRDLGYRLAGAGLVGVYDPALGAEHRHQRSDAEFLRDASRQGAGTVALHRAHPRRLGPLCVDDLVADLPAPLRAAVRTVGSTRWAPVSARALMLLARVTGGGGRAGLVPAKLARRIMQWHRAHAAVLEPLRERARPGPG